jgi:SAM-dependent methyltransferase
VGRPQAPLRPSVYDPIAGIYDPWSRSVTEDIDFYVEEALAAGGPVVELAVGTGRIAVPIAQAGVPVIGVDASEGMLAVARDYARERGVERLVDLRRGDLRAPPVDGPVPLVLAPFRSLLHMETDTDRLAALAAARALLEEDGRFVFDVFAPGPDDIEATNGRWIEREPGIFERADWDEGARTLVLSVRGGEAYGTMSLAWLSPPDWHALLERAGFSVLACYGWFDRRPYDGGEDTVWVAQRREP